MGLNISSGSFFLLRLEQAFISNFILYWNRNEVKISVLCKKKQNHFYLFWFCCLKWKRWVNIKIIRLKKYFRYFYVNWQYKIYWCFKFIDDLFVRFEFESACLCHSSKKMMTRRKIKVISSDFHNRHIRVWILLVAETIHPIQMVAIHFIYAG